MRRAAGSRFRSGAGARDRLVGARRAGALGRDAGRPGGLLGRGGLRRGRRARGFDRRGLRVLVVVVALVLARHALIDLAHPAAELASVLRQSLGPEYEQGDNQYENVREW